MIVNNLNVRNAALVAFGFIIHYLYSLFRVYISRVLCIVPGQELQRKPGISSTLRFIFIMVYSIYLYAYG